MSLRNITLLTGVISTALFSYIVKDGDTLWDLSDAFLQDPFKWTQIWEGNPQIQDPNLIYPGDEITLDGKPAPEPPSLDTITTEENTTVDDTLPRYMTYNGRGIKERHKEDFVNRLGALGNNFKEQEDDLNNLKSAIPDTLAYRPKPRILKPILQEQAPLLIKPYTAYRTYDNEFQINRESKASGTVFKWGDDIIVEGGSKNGFNEGDTLELFYHTTERTQVVLTGKKRATLCVVKPQALAILTSVSDKRSRARIIKTFGSITEDNSRARIYKKRPVRYVNYYNPVQSVDLTQAASVSYIFGESEVLKYYNWIAINRGSTEGYRPGDAVYIIENREDKTLKPRTIATGIVIVSQEQTATVLIKNIQYAARNIQMFDKVVIVQKAME